MAPETKKVKEDKLFNESVKSLEETKIKNVIDEWSGLTPTKKDMGVVQLILDKGTKTTVIGTIYGLDYEIEEEGYKTTVFFDYYNRRLKVVDYDCTNYSAMLQRLAWIADANNFDKIFVKATPDDFQQFLSHGYIMEGILKYYFKGKDAYVLSRFSSLDRMSSPELFKETELVEKIIYHSNPPKKRSLPEDIKIIHADKNDIAELAYIYRNVFETYPSPLTSPDYINSVINRNVHFVIAKRNNDPIAAASAEINFKHSNAEMTDCATIPAAQGQGIMQFLLIELEEFLRKEKIQTAYTLARAKSIGMNKSFFRLDYEYSGRLIKNCDIFGQFEDMHIWVKKLLNN